MPAAIEKVLEVVLKKIDTAFENRSDGDIGTLTAVQMA